MDIENFDDFPWHDALLLDLSVDRREPGTRDEVKLQISWPDNSISTIVFDDCYAMQAKMNFGVIAEESILSAYIVKKDKFMQTLVKDWETMGVKLDSLKCFRIETNSTASIIEIYAKSFLVIIDKE